jgi:predicted DNA-binding transcriptional regulator YafY
MRPSAEAASTAIIVDPAGWDQPVRTRPAPGHLEAVQRAVVEGEQIVLGYVGRTREPTTRVVHPLGLAAKGPVWYLIGDTQAGLRTFRVDRITAVEQTGEPVVRPEGFELTEAWRLIVDEVEQRRTPVVARAFVAPNFIGILRMLLGTRVRIGAAGSDGRVEVELRGHSHRSLAGEIAGVGAALEIVDPPELRVHLRQIGTELADLYAR